MTGRAGTSRRAGRILGLALGVALGLTMCTAAAAAAPATGGTDPGPAAPHVAENTTKSHIINYPCWTSFHPVNPRGESMAQIYNNCGSTGYNVCAGVILFGQKTVWYETRWWVGPSDNSNNDDLVIWEYPSTEPYGAQYVTEFC